MRKSFFALGLAAAAGAAGLSLSFERAAPEKERTLTASLFDPAVIGRSLCGEQGQNRGVFFRPEFHLALAAKAAAEEKKPELPQLWDGLVTRSFKVSTDNAQAQAYFDQGFALIYGFNHWEAIRAFKAAQSLDPDCALCYWGEAIALGPNINAPMVPGAVEPAFAAISKAVSLAGTASEKERALIEAAAKRYSPDPEAKRSDLDRAFADAMEAVAAQYPEDEDIAALTAEAIMDLTPWEYWERDFATPRPHIARALKLVEGILEKNPDHPAAIHLYIHLTEASVSPEKAEPYADRLAALMPGAGHMVHMPGHTFFRVGRYLDALDTNVQAVAVDEAYLNAVEGSDIYRYGYYPHNVHFVLVSAQMAGDEKTVLAFAEKLDKLIPIAATKGAPWIQPIKVAPYFAFAQFGTTDQVLALPEPPMEVPYVRAMWHYARGLVLARDGRALEANAEADAIAALNKRDNLRDMIEGNIPAPDLLRIAEITVRGRVAQANRSFGHALGFFSEAARLQQTVIYAEPPYWYYPAEQSVGSAYLEMGVPEEAARAFRAALVKHPNNAWSLYGLMLAQRDAGDPAAKETEALFENASRSQQEIPVNRL